MRKKCSKPVENGAGPLSSVATKPTKPSLEDIEIKETKAQIRAEETETKISPETQHESWAEESKAQISPEKRQKLEDYFYGSEVERFQVASVFADEGHMPNFIESTLVGTLVGSKSDENRNQSRNQKLRNSGTDTKQGNQKQVFLNTHEPFCMVTVGSQGGGKSHTLATVLEGCLIPFCGNDVCRLKKPMTTLVLYYDESASTLCEVVTL